MSKTTSVRTFDRQFLGSSVREDLDPLVDFLNSLSDNFSQLTQNGISLSANLNGQIIASTFVPAVPKQLKVKSRPVFTQLSMGALPVIGVIKNISPTIIEVTVHLLPGFTATSVATEILVVYS